MPTMDVFNSDAFSMTSLTGTVDKIDFVPGYLGELGVFEPEPVRTREVYVDVRDGQVTLIPDSPLGSPPESLERDERSAVPLRLTRLAKEFTMYAYEIEGIRGFGTEDGFVNLQAEYLRRMARLRDDLELTKEYHRLGAVQGILLDADGTTVIRNYFTDFGISQPAGITFAFSTDSTDVKAVCHSVVRAMTRAARGAFNPRTRIHAICGDEFYDNLISHPNVEKFYIQWSAAEGLRNTGPFESFRFGGITFHNYRGTDDNSTVAVSPRKARFFPTGARDVFKEAMGPAEFGPYMNTLGRDVYALNVVDQQRQAWAKGEVYSYPLFLCQRPEVLREGMSV